MGFAQWFWRLFFLLAGLIVAHVSFVTLLVWLPEKSAASSLTAIWLSAVVVIAGGGIAIWHSVRRIVGPLSELSRQVRSTSRSGASQGFFDQRDDVGLLAGAFDQMQRDLKSRLDQIQDHGERLATVLSNMAEG